MRADGQNNQRGNKALRYGWTCVITQQHAGRRQLIYLLHQAKAIKFAKSDFISQSWFFSSQAKTALTPVLTLRIELCCEKPACSFD